MIKAPCSGPRGPRLPAKATQRVGDEGHQADGSREPQGSVGLGADGFVTHVGYGRGRTGRGGLAVPEAAAAHHRLHGAHPGRGRHALGQPGVCASRRKSSRLCARRSMRCTGAVSYACTRPGNVSDCWSYLRQRSEGVGAGGDLDGNDGLPSKQQITVVCPRYLSRYLSERVATVIGAGGSGTQSQCRAPIDIAPSTYPHRESRG